MEVLEYSRIPDLLEALELTRRQFPSIRHVDEEPRSHVNYLRARTGQFYPRGRNEETAVRIVLVGALVRDHGFNKDEACSRACESILVQRVGHEADPLDRQ